MGCAGCESKALSLLGHCGGVKLVFCLFIGVDGLQGSAVFQAVEFE